MSEKNKEIVRKYREIHNKSKMDELGSVLAENFVAHSMVPKVPQTLEGAKMIHKNGTGYFPDVQVTTEALIAEGDLVVERWKMVGHHTGTPFFIGNLPASGKKIDVTGINIYRIADGKIIETWANMDFLALMSQLGIMPS